MDWTWKDEQICLCGGQREAFFGVFYILGTLTMLSSMALPSFHSSASLKWAALVLSLPERGHYADREPVPLRPCLF